MVSSQLIRIIRRSRLHAGGTAEPDQHRSYDRLTVIHRDTALGFGTGLVGGIDASGTAALRPAP